MDLALDDQRVDDAAEVVGAGELLAHRAGFAIDYLGDGPGGMGVMGS
jgi:hypothetical protein